MLVSANTLSQVQTTAPAYVPAGWPSTVQRTGHAGIEIHAFAFEDELLLPELRAALAVRDIRVERNSVTDTAANGARIGEGTNVISTLTGTRSDGSGVTRRYSAADTGRISLSALSFAGTGGRALAVKSARSEAYNVHCEALTDGGAALTDAACAGVAPKVTGASMSCGG